MSWNFTQPQQHPGMQSHYQQNHPQYVQQGQQSQQYGQYGQFYAQNVFEMNAWQAYNMSAEQELRHIFEQVKNSDQTNMMSNGIQKEHFHQIMNGTPSIHNYYKISWSMELCGVLMAMMDRNPDGFMQWEEFVEVQQCLLAWHKMFHQYDANRSGFIEANELSQVIQRFGFNITQQVLTMLLKRYSKAHMANGQIHTLIAFDDFVSLCVRLRAYTDAFRKRDRLCNGRETGSTVFTYNDGARSSFKSLLMTASWLRIQYSLRFVGYSRQMKDGFVPCLCDVFIRRLIFEG